MSSVTFLSSGYGRLTPHSEVVPQVGGYGRLTPHIGFWGVLIPTNTWDFRRDGLTSQVNRRRGRVRCVGF